MGNPENSPPARPQKVPAEARWDPKDPGFEWVVGGLDAEGRRHGPYRSWTRDGVLHGKSNYVHGKVHGKNINFHPDGTVASEAEWVMGLILDSVFYRSDAPTTEPFAQAAPSVWSVRYYTRDGKTNYTIRYFSRDGTECGPDGNALPPRPAHVSAEARWFPDMERWVDGAIERGSNNQVGPWRWWSREGVLRHEEMRDGSGRPTMIAQYEPDGSLKKQTTRSADGEQRDYYFDHGQLSTRCREDAKGRQIYKASWSRDGELDEECTRTFTPDSTGDDALASVTERGRGGALRFEARREGPGLACVLYAGDGKTLAATGMIVDDKLSGTWRIFDDRGVLRREVDATPLSIEQRSTAQGLAWQLGHVLYATDEAMLPTPPQLVGIDDLPWAETPGCFDEHVEAFPRMLRGLASPDPLIREYCLGAIESEIEHQGSTYPATARVIPWLARLLSHPDVDRPRLLEVIRQAAENVAPYLAEVKDLDADDPDRVAIEGTHDAIGAAWPDIFACFWGATPQERRLVLAVAKLAPGSKASIAEVACNDADASLRACAVDTLVAMPSCELVDVMRCLADKDALVRAATAIAIALAHGPAAPREVVAALREAVHGHQDIAARFAELPHADGHVLAYLALAAGAVCTPDARSLVQALCERIDEVDGRSAVTYGQGLLALAFGRGDRPFAKRFVEVLDTLATSQQLWLFDVDARELLGAWNLPRGRDELKELVGRLKANPEPETWLHAKMHRP
jgi:hypothetical protein